MLWLLHGTFGDHTDWVRKTNIEMYATERNLVVVMPSALNSNYSNWNDYMLGYRMFDFLTEELMPMIYGWFPVSDNKARGSRSRVWTLPHRLADPFGDGLDPV